MKNQNHKNFTAAADTTMTAPALKVDAVPAAAVLPTISNNSVLDCINIVKDEMAKLINETSTKALSQAEEGNRARIGLKLNQYFSALSSLEELYIHLKKKDKEERKNGN
jgi:hypothetical protein